MFELTRLDGIPLWLNPSHVVAVQSSNTGTTEIVTTECGHGDHWQVKESVATVLAGIEAAEKE